jgi:hypothetical protein
MLAKLPALQARHALRPAKDWYFPALHPSHTALALAVERVPGAQARHVDAAWPVL